MKLKIFSLVIMLISGMTFATSHDEETTEVSDTVDTEIATIENEKLPEAPKQLVEELNVECKQFAKEDSVSKKSLNQYVLDCINVELDIIGHRMIKKLPK